MSSTSAPDGTGAPRLVGSWKPGGSTVVVMALLAAVGLGGVVALIVLKGQLPNKELPTALMIFFIFLALLVAAPGLVVLYGRFGNGGTRLYEDRLEIHALFWPWSFNIFSLSEIAGIGLFLHEFQQVTSAPRTGSSTATATVRQWQCAILESENDVAVLDSIASECDSDPTKLTAQREDELKTTQAAQIVTAAYEQALRCQGPGGKLSKPIHLSSAAANAAAAAGSQAPVLIASWSPYDGLKMVGEEQSAKLDETGLPVADDGKGGRKAPDTWTYVKELSLKDPKVVAYDKTLPPGRIAARFWRRVLPQILGPSEVVAAGAEASKGRVISSTGDAEETRQVQYYSAALIVTNERVLYLDSPPARYLQWRLDDVVYVQPIERDPLRLGHRSVTFSVVDGSSMEVSLGFAQSETITQLEEVLKGKDNRDPAGT